MYKVFLVVLLSAFCFKGVTAQDASNPYKDLKFNNKEEGTQEDRDYKQFAEIFKKIISASPDYDGLVGEVYAKGKYDVPMHRVKLEVNFANEQFIVNEGIDGETDYGYFLAVHESNEAAAIETEKAMVRAISVKMLMAGWGKASRGSAPLEKGDYSIKWSKGSTNFVWIYHYKKDDHWVVELEILTA